MTYNYAQTPEKDFGNIDYFVSDWDHGRKVTLNNGQYYEEHILHVSYAHFFIYNDFDNDGLQDAAVIFNEDGTGSNFSLILAFLIYDGTHFIHRASYSLERAWEIRSLKIVNNKIIIDILLKRTDNDPEYIKHPLERVKKAFTYPGPQWQDITHSLEMTRAK